MSSSFVSSNFAAYSPIRSVGLAVMATSFGIRRAAVRYFVDQQNGFFARNDAGFWQAAKPV